MSLETGEKNPRGIPKAPFIVDVDAHLGGPDADAEGPLKAIQESIGKYRYMDSNLTQRRQGLEEKIPDIKKTLGMVEFLRDRREGKSSDEDDDLDEDEDEDTPNSNSKPLKTSFELNDTLFAEAELEDTDTVFLWLGVRPPPLLPSSSSSSPTTKYAFSLPPTHPQANVMLSYPLSDAITLLQAKLQAAETSLGNTIEDLEFLREQITVMEVNMARVYNADVKRRRERRVKAEAAEKEKTGG
ncbi:hypothetical protein V5O48_018357 [Marasmius crinis-equi]|uniref:Prefoldin subunit 3 n=1 Tax=Marasmius crinis-equi TaxID=585013 RepID=A0ABR3ELH9_9AGAR